MLQLKKGLHNDITPQIGMKMKNIWNHQPYKNNLDKGNPSKLLHICIVWSPKNDPLLFGNSSPGFKKKIPLKINAWNLKITHYSQRKIIWTIHLHFLRFIWRIVVGKTEIYNIFPPNGWFTKIGSWRFPWDPNPNPNANPLVQKNITVQLRQIQVHRIDRCMVYIVTYMKTH